MEFVRYDDLDTDYGPEFEQDLNAVIAEVEAAIRGSVAAEGADTAVRFLPNAEGFYGLLEGELEILEVDEIRGYAQGVPSPPRGATRPW